VCWALPIFCNNLIGWTVNGMYSRSRYNYCYPKDDAVVIFNTYNQTLALLEPEYYPQFLQVDETCKYADEFKRLGFWVDHDEVQEILEKHEKAVENKEELRVVLRMTDACNFRCPYCYQGHERAMMDEEKIKRIKLFLGKQRKEGQKVLVHYFGGEPLLNLKGILEVDRYLQEQTAEYRATLTTNGYLLNKAAILQLKDTKIRSYQITLDGPPEVHNKTRVLANGEGTFGTLLENIKSLLELTDVRLTIRFNVSKKNICYAEELLELLNQEQILQNQKVRLLFPQLHNYSDQKDSETYYENEEYFHDLLKIMELLIHYKKKIPRYGPIFTSCNMYAKNTFVISPDLELEICTSQEDQVGRIDEEGNAVFNENVSMKERYFAVEEKCKECILLPMCMGGCRLKQSRNQNCCIMDVADLKPYIDLKIKEKAEA